MAMRTSRKRALVAGVLDGTGSAPVLSSDELLGAAARLIIMMRQDMRIPALIFLAATSAFACLLADPAPSAAERAKQYAELLHKGRALEDAGKLAGRGQGLSRLV